MRSWLVILLLAAGACTPTPSLFACTDATMCVLDGELGTCEPSGFCSFPDVDCPTGWRYEDFASPDLAGMCVGFGGGSCENGEDDDGDGAIDAADPGCADESDGDEHGSDVCDNGLDDDDDGTKDFRADGMGDVGCTSPAGTSELSGAVCNDGMDNDSDGDIDYRTDGSGDDGCTDLLDGAETGGAACDNGIDDDVDGFADYPADPGCTSLVDNDEHGTSVCDNGLDDDADGRTDYRTDAAGDVCCFAPTSATETCTVAFRAAAANTAGTVTSLTILKPAGTVTSDVMIASIAVRPETVTVTPPAGWVLVRRIDNAAATQSSLAIYRKVAGAGEPASYAWTFTVLEASAGGIQSFSGVDLANPINIENGVATADSLSHSPPSVTTTLANTMLVTSHTMSSPTTWTPPAGMTEAFDVSFGPALGTGQSIEGNYVIQAAAAATGLKTATAAGDADTGNAHILALKPR